MARLSGRKSSGRVQFKAPRGVGLATATAEAERTGRGTRGFGLERPRPRPSGRDAAKITGGELSIIESAAIDFWPVGKSFPSAGECQVAGGGLMKPGASISSF